MSLKDDFIKLRSDFFLAKNDWEKNYKPKLWAQGVRVAIYRIDDLGREIEKMFNQASNYLGVTKYELAQPAYLLRFGTAIITFASLSLLVFYISKKVTEYATAYKAISNPNIPELVKQKIVDRVFPEPEKTFSIPGFPDLKISQNILLLIGALLLFLMLGKK